MECAYASWTLTKFKPSTLQKKLLLKVEAAAYKCDVLLNEKASRSRTPSLVREEELEKVSKNVRDYCRLMIAVGNLFRKPAEMPRG